MRSGVFAPDAEGEGRLLLLIAAFSRKDRMLQGRVKLAKLDFFLRYPRFYQRAMQLRGRDVEAGEGTEPAIEQRMIRYRYGPWDPAYYALLGSLIGRGLVVTLPEPRFLGFRVTEAGADLADELAENPAWTQTAQRARTLRTEFGDHTGSYLMRFVYEHFPEVVGEKWGASL